MSYQSALKAAGAEVIHTLYTGSYQGTWGSIVIYKGNKGLVTGAYGSCSHCDAFQGEFDYYGYDDSRIEKDETTGKYYRGYYLEDDGSNEATEEEYNRSTAEYEQKLAAFGSTYLQGIQDKWDVQNRINQFNAKGEDDWFDSEEIELYKWAIKFFD